MATGALTRREPRRRAQLGALLYLQARSTIRKWRLVLADPLRRLAWVPFGGGFVWLLVVRATGFHVHPSPDLWRITALVLPSLFFVVVALSRASGGRLHPSRAHAHLVGGLGVPVWLLVAWQQLQRLPSLLLGLAFFGVLVLPSFLGLGLERVLTTAISVLIGFAFLSGAGLVGFSVRLWRSWVGTAWTATWLLVAGVLALPALVLAVDVPVPALRPLETVASWTPGGLVARGASGDLAADALLVLISAAVLALAVWMTRDQGPELAEASYRFFALVDSARANQTASMSGSTLRRRKPLERSASTRLAGAGVLAWKTWLEFKRSASGRWRLFGVAFQLTFGAGLASIWQGFGGHHMRPALTTVLVAGIVLSMVAAGFTSHRQFGPLLRNPLFGLNRDSLPRRLTAVLVTRQLTESIGNLATFVGVALVLPGLIPLVLVLIVVSRSVAVGMLALDLWVFSWLPSATDRTMAMRVIRTVLMALLVPLGTAFALYAFRTQAPDLLLLLPVPVFLVGGWLLVSAAGRRLEGNGLAVAMAERR
jgi:Putative ABC exporter